MEVEEEFYTPPHQHKKIKSSISNSRKVNSLSNWIREFEENFYNNVDILPETRDNIEITFLKSKTRKKFYDNYLPNLEDKLDIESSKKVVSYLDFFPEASALKTVEKEAEEFNKRKKERESNKKEKDDRFYFFPTPKNKTKKDTKKKKLNVQ